MQPVSAAFPAFAALTAAAAGWVPQKRRWQLLLIFSLWWAAAEGGMLVTLPLTTALSAWFCALGVKRRRWLLGACLLLNFGILFVCKGLLLASSIPALPLGISFYTFQAMGYVLDVSREKTVPERNFFRVALFTMFYPQLVQGPISRWNELAPELFAGGERVWEDFRQGIQRMLWGYFKKLVIADRIAPAAAALARGDFGGIGTLALSAVYCIRIYGDFTGGMDIALGLARLLGIRLPENFDRPFGADSFAEFWRRWHITLGAWMRDYVFYPLCVCRSMRRLGRWSRGHLGSFGKKLPVLLASCLTWLATGFWHGLSFNFPLWGLLNFGVISLSPLLRGKGHSRLWIYVTFFAMNLVRICDLYPDVGEYAGRLLAIFMDFRWRLPVHELGLTHWDWAVVAAGFPLALYVDAAPRRMKLWQLAVLLIAVLLLGSYGIGYSARSFIYNGF